MLSFPVSVIIYTVEMLISYVGSNEKVNSSLQE